MANDRIYLICATCRAQIVLYKYYPLSGYLWGPDMIDAFLHDHLSTCHPRAGMTLQGLVGFELATESTEEDYARERTNPSPRA